nr:IPT/TIG domain-containing protein [Solimonas terrae]
MAPASVSASLQQGASYRFTETATISGDASVVGFVSIVDQGGAIESGSDLQQVGSGSYSVGFVTRSDLGVGEHKGSLALKLCSNSSCGTVYARASLPYDFTVLPAPSVSGISPATAYAGGPAFRLTVNGANFASNSQVTWNGQSRLTTYVSSSQVTAEIGANDIAASGTYAVGITGSVSSVNFTVQNPSLSALSPNSATAGGAAFTLSVSGSGFSSSSIVLWNGSPRSTSFVSASQLSANIAQADIATGGTVNVSVNNGSGASSNAAIFAVNNPVPVLASASPSSVTAGSAAFILTVSGSAFEPSSVVQWNGSARPTTYLSATSLSAQIAAGDVADGTMAAVTVLSPAPGGGSSAALAVTVNNSVPHLTTINASSAAAGCGDFTLYVIGSSFVPSSSVSWNGSARPTSFVSPKVLAAQVSAADIASAGTASVKVSSPLPAGGVSSAANFTITSTVPVTTDAVSYLVNPAHTGEALTSCPLKMPDSPAWTKTFGIAPSYPLVAEGHVFVVADQLLYALDGDSGEDVWSPVISNGDGPAYENGTIFEVGNAACCSGGVMLAFDAATGALRWTGAMPYQYVFDAAATARNGLVYTSAAGSGGTVYALRESDGSLAWAAGVAGGDNSTPAVTDSGLYVAYPCQAYDFDPTTGGLVWYHGGGCDGGGGGVAVVGSVGAVMPDGFGSYAGDYLDSGTGALINTYFSETPPALSGKYGYMVKSGSIQKVNLSTNALAWSFSGDGQLAAAPVLVNQVMFAVSTNGNLYAVDTTTGQQLWDTHLSNGTEPGIGWGHGFGPAMTAGDNLLVVPNGNALTAFRIAAPH